MCENKKQVRVVRFSPAGRMVIVGLSSGLVMTFYISLVMDSKDEIAHLALKYFQSFKPEQSSEIVSM